MAVGFDPTVISRLRKERGLSRYKLGQMVGTTSSQIKGWEEGDISPTTKKVVLMCNLFHKDPNFFFKIDRRGW